MHKKISVKLFLVSLLFYCVLLVSFAGILRNIYLGGKRFTSIKPFVLAIAQYPSQLIDILNNRNPILKNQILLNPFKLETGVTYNKNKYLDSGFLLVSSYKKGYNQCIISLVSLHDNKSIHEWIPPIERIQKKLDSTTNPSQNYKLTKSTFTLTQPLLLSDGSIIGIVGGAAGGLNSGGPIIKLDSASKLVWITAGKFDHSLTEDTDHSFLVQSYTDFSRIEYLKEYKIQDDAITKISAEGKILWKKSVAEILSDNHLDILLTGPGVNEDPLHLNEIKPARVSTKYWDKGDLLLSLRHRSTVLLYRPNLNKVLWSKTGPWLNQHCSNFVDSSRISIFGNDVVRINSLRNLESNILNEATFSLNGYNNIYIYDFAKDIVTQPYTDIMKKLNVFTNTQGRVKVLKNGDIVVDESEKGRIFRANTKDVIWQYINKIDEKHISFTNWSRYLTKKGTCTFCYFE